jgi:hypothetical protein
MPDARTATTPDAPPDPNPPGAAKESRVGRILALVRKLIDYGRELATTLHGRDPATHARHFGTSDIALILVRITQGLHRARALEERLVRNATRLDAPHRPQPTPTQHKPRTTQPTGTAATPDGPVPGLTRGSACPRPSRSPHRSVVARSAPSSPISAGISASCRTIRCGGD